MPIRGGLFTELRDIISTQEKYYRSFNVYIFEGGLLCAKKALYDLFMSLNRPK